MSATPNKHSGPGFSSYNLPGSVAEQEEVERLAEFQRMKALRKEEEERNKPALVAKRQAAYDAEVEARLKLKQNSRPAYRNVLKP